ncbi:MAG TPA: Hsp20/alpha crystallin family protein [Vicinamibacterales bacterium]|nr:Hsp20/alpha crystallin family protein [Vicinamibacterales bacterium]
MAFARWDPLRDLFALQERVERLAEAGTPGWTPPVDLYETADRFVITVELPGIAREDIDIRFHDGVLTVQGQRREPAVPCERYHRVERGHGTFMRRFTLGTPIEADTISADFSGGILTIVAPKTADGRARRIEIL